MDMSGDGSAPSFDIVADTRRRWSLKEKRAIVAEASGSCTNISAVARRHCIKPALLYRWKKELGSDQATPSACSFVPVTIAASTVKPADESTSMASASQTPGRAYAPASIEIELRNGRRLRVDSSVEPQQLKRIIDALES